MRVVLTGAAGMLGSAITAAWPLLRPDDDLIAWDRAAVDLRDRGATRQALAMTRPDAIIHTAARVGGIADKIAHPAAYLADNLAIDAAVIGAASELRIPELLYLGSAAVYPEHVSQPIREDAMLAGPLEGANEPYAIAKIAGIKNCEYVSREHGLAFRAAIPSNLYGVDDRSDPGRAHLIAAALAKVERASRAGEPTVTVWGDGTARREFTFAGDLASWLIGQLGALAAWPAWLNLGVGVDHTVSEYYALAMEIAGFRGELRFDASAPAGVPQRLLDSSAARVLGWEPATPLRTGMTALHDRIRTAKGS